MAGESSGAGRAPERGRRRVWSELVPFEDVRAPRVLGLLQRYGLELAVAVRPETAPALPDLVAACAGAGVPVAVWPMIDDAEGRWANEGNAAAFGAFVARVLGALEARGLAPAEIVVDLEPAIDRVRAVLPRPDGARLGEAARVILGAAGLVERGRGGGRGGGSGSGSGRGSGHGGAGGRGGEERGAAAGEAAYAELAAGLAARGVSVSAAVVPLVLLDGEERAWERLLGTPVSAAPWSHVSVMLYTSMLERWSRGVLGRRDAVALLAWGAGAAARRFGARAGVSVGAVGIGALGDEPVYRGVAELREDVAAAVAGGVSDLSLFDLGGVLARPPAEAWLEAFAAPPDARPAPAPTPRAWCAVAALAIAGRAAAPRRTRAGGTRERGVPTHVGPGARGSW